MRTRNSAPLSAYVCEIGPRMAFHPLLWIDTLSKGIEYI